MRHGRPESFSIHSPLAGRDRRAWPWRAALWIFNPLAPCGARPSDAGGHRQHQGFSIHSPLAGRDQCGERGCHGGRRFQSTRPLRGETKSVPECCRAMVFFNPLAPCGARHASMQQAYGLSDFSIHSPLAGRDMLEMTAIDRNVEVFNPLAPCGARPGGHAGL